MIRPLLPVIAVLGSAAAASAQCLGPSLGTNVALANPDDALSAPLPMGISFNFPGVATNYTHCVVSTNGVLYLTTGGAASNASAAQYGTLAQLSGTATASPRIAPFWNDLADAFFPGVAWSVRIDTSVAGRCAVTWKDTCEVNSDVPPCDFRAELFASGVVRFTYGNINTFGFTNITTVGLSRGGAVAVPGASDLSATSAANTPILFEQFAPLDFDLANRQITFTPGGGGYAVTTTCFLPPAGHSSLGPGCYTVSDSFYQLFPDAEATAPALTGRSLTLTRSGSQYNAQLGGGTFVNPTSPVTLAFSPNDDDGVTTISLGSPLPIPGGSTGSLVVHSNGNVWVGDNLPALSLDSVPDVLDFLFANATGWWSWHDFNPAEACSGGIVFHEVGSTSYVTWQGVENYPLGVSNPSTMQFQFDRSNGTVRIVWPSIDSNATSIFGSAHLVGYSPGGGSIDGGSINLATALPLLTSSGQLSPVLNAFPRPLSTATTGTSVSYRTTGMPEFLPGSGLFVGLFVLSLGQSPGINLNFLGAPDCPAYVASLDLTIALVGNTPSQAATFNLPPGVPGGTTLFAQTACLVTPNSLPNGQNAAGLTTSSGLRTVINSF